MAITLLLMSVISSELPRMFRFLTASVLSWNVVRTLSGVLTCVAMIRLPSVTRSIPSMLFTLDTMIATSLSLKRVLFSLARMTAMGICLGGVIVDTTVVKRGLSFSDTFFSSIPSTFSAMHLLTVFSKSWRISATASSM